MERMLAGVVEFGLVALGLVVLLVLLPRLLERFNRADGAGS
jgi:hypothetical protein